MNTTDMLVRMLCEATQDKNELSETISRLQTQILENDQRVIIPTQREVQGLLKALAEYGPTVGGSKIMAIKEYRALFGVGLKDAKDAIEAILPRH